MSSFHCLVSNDDCTPELIENIAKKKADLNLRNKTYQTPLILAMKRKQHRQKIISILLKYGSDPNLIDSRGIFLFILF